jgi:hypothetical protein
LGLAPFSLLKEDEMRSMIIIAVLSASSAAQAECHTVTMQPHPSHPNPACDYARANWRSIPGGGALMTKCNNEERCEGELVSDERFATRWTPALAGKLVEVTHSRPDNYCVGVLSRERLIECSTVPDTTTTRELTPKAGEWHALRDWINGLGPCTNAEWANMNASFCAKVQQDGGYETLAVFRGSAAPCIVGERCRAFGQHFGTIYFNVDWLQEPVTVERP